MVAEILYGAPLAERLKAEAAAEVASLRRRGTPPSVVAIHNSGNPACRVYLRMQKNLCSKLGIAYSVREIGSSTPPSEVLEAIGVLNKDPRVTGITAHMPLPPGMEAKEVLRAISPEKDVEGTHPHNLGMLVYEDHDPCPSAARAAVEIVRTVHPSFRGLEAVIIGHSEMVGKSICYLLLQSRLESATPTICHVATRDLRAHTRRADVLFVAAGKAGLVRGDMIKPGATVIDIGINEGPSGTMVGDVVFEEARRVAGWITPVPGGVGPVTLAVLLRNIAVCARRLA